MDARVKPAHDAECGARAILTRFPIHLSNSPPSPKATAGKPTLRRPVSLRRRVRRRLWGRSASPGRRTEGARDARGPKGPAGLDASRHRGLSKSLCLAFRSGSSDRQSVPQVRQTQGVPRAVFNRLAPHRPRWSHFSRVMPVGAAPRLPTDEAMALGQRPLTGLFAPAYRPSRASGAQTRRAGPDAAWTAGPGDRISDARS